MENQSLITTCTTKKFLSKHNRFHQTHIDKELRTKTGLNYGYNSKPAELTMKPLYHCLICGLLKLVFASKKARSSLGTCVEEPPPIASLVPVNNLVLCYGISPPPPNSPMSCHGPTSLPAQTIFSSQQQFPSKTNNTWLGLLSARLAINKNTLGSWNLAQINGHKEPQVNNYGEMVSVSQLQLNFDIMPAMGDIQRVVSPKAMFHYDPGLQWKTNFALNAKVICTTTHRG